MDKYLVINPLDNVAVCLVEGEKVKRGHKIARKDIKKGEYIFKYGNIIGRATEDIKEGEWVHTHNIESHLDEKVTYKYEYTHFEPTLGKKTFKGYKRKVGRPGIRNEIFIIPTVGCVNNVCKKIEERAQSLITGSIDGIYSFPHQFGCSQLGEDGENIKKALAGIALNPNASYVLIVGLGCENNSLKGMKEYLSKYNRDNIEYYNCQDVEDDVEYGLEIIEGFVEKCKDLKREDIDFSQLLIGLKCGGSDGFSGITANPLVGRVMDKVVSFGGSGILTEVPEMFGAEQILMNKCKNEEVFTRYMHMIEDFKYYYTSQGFPVYENPSPGNKEGGISTLEEKSLGCIEKAGRTDIVDVIYYGQIAEERGITILDGPGNDLIASTSLGISGCQIVLFTTGRGTPFSTFVPTVKISTNFPLYEKKRNWIDFDSSTFDEEGLFEYILKVINGEVKTKNEGYREIAFYKKGVTL